MNPISATHRHYKGGLYQVLGEGIHDANNGHDYERLVVFYRSLETGDLSWRYESEFFEVFETEGGRVPRFQPLGV